MEHPLTIAVDFDGTIVEHKYPEIGREMLFAFQTLKALQKKGHRLILWTYRSGTELDEAVAFCKKNGVEFYAINASYPEETFDAQKQSRKLDVDLFIDDRNFGGFPGWGRIWNMMYPDNSEQLNTTPLYPEEHFNRTKKKGFFSKWMK